MKSKDESGKGGRIIARFDDVRIIKSMILCWENDDFMLRRSWCCTEKLMLLYYENDAFVLKNDDFINQGRCRARRDRGFLSRPRGYATRFDFTQELTSLHRKSWILHQKSVIFALKSESDYAALEGVLGPDKPDDTHQVSQNHGLYSKNRWIS